MDQNYSVSSGYFDAAIDLLKNLDEFAAQVRDFPLKENLEFNLENVIVKLKDLFRDRENANEEFRAALKLVYPQFSDTGDSRELVLCILGLIHETCVRCDSDCLCPSHGSFASFKEGFFDFEFFAVTLFDQPGMINQLE